MGLAFFFASVNCEHSTSLVCPFGHHDPKDLLFLLFVQDIGHAHGAHEPPRESMSRTLLSLAGFQVIFIGRFWRVVHACCNVATLMVNADASPRRVSRLCNFEQTARKPRL
jgi:hypothetical protein